MQWDWNWVWASSFSLAATNEMHFCFFSSGYWNVLLHRVSLPTKVLESPGMTQEGFPHSEIFGSKVVRHLPETYRRQTASFITSSSQGIHRTPLNFLLGNLKTTFTFFPNSSALYSRDRLGLRHSKCRSCFCPSTHIKTPEFLLIKETQKLVCDGI